MKIKMTAGLSGPTMSLAPGDSKFFEDADEAQRLIDAGFAELVLDEESPMAETATERVARLKEELEIAQRTLDGEGTSPVAPEAPAKTGAAKPAKPKA